MTWPRQAAGPPRIMVVGIGNLDRGDDGAGPAVLGRLAGRVPGKVELRLCRGDLLALVGDWAGVDGLVCIDAAQSMGSPGRIHRFDPAAGELPRWSALPASSHAFGLADALALARVLGAAPARVVVLAVEGRSFEGGAALSAEVDAALPELTDQVVQEVEGLCRLLEEPA